MVCSKTEFFYALMEKSGVRPVELAKKAEVNVNVVYRMRKGYLVRRDALTKVCGALGADPEAVIDYERMERAGMRAE